MQKVSAHTGATMRTKECLRCEKFIALGYSSLWKLLSGNMVVAVSVRCSGDTFAGEFVGEEVVCGVDRESELLTKRLRSPRNVSV